MAVLHFFLENSPLIYILFSMGVDLTQLYFSVALYMYILAL